MLYSKKFATVLMGLVLSLGILFAETKDVEAGSEYVYTVGSYITNNTETRLFTEADANSGVVAELPVNSVVTVVENNEVYTKVSYNGAVGYLYQEFIGYDEAAIAAYEAELLARSEEVKLLAAIIQLEAGGESYEGQIAVGAVVMNRMKSASYPNTVSEVIYQAGQFTPADTDKMAHLVETGNIKESCRAAATEAFTGVDNVGGLLHFRRNNGRSGLVIGNHVFY